MADIGTAAVFSVEDMSLSRFLNGIGDCGMGNPSPKIK